MVDDVPQGQAPSSWHTERRISVCDDPEELLEQCLATGVIAWKLIFLALCRRNTKIVTRSNIPKGTKKDMIRRRIHSAGMKVSLPVELL